MNMELDNNTDSAEFNNVSTGNAGWVESFRGRNSKAVAAGKEDVAYLERTKGSTAKASSTTARKSDKGTTTETNQSLY